MRVPGRPPVLPDIVEEHFDELDWLWEHREANVFTPDWTLEDLAWCEERAEAHLDGLRLAELHGIDLARARIGSGEPSAALAATLVLCSDPSEAPLDLVRDALRAGEPPIVDGVRRALRHSLPEALLPTLHELAADHDLLRAAAALDVLAFRRLPLPAFDARLFGHELAPVKCLAIGAATRAGASQALEQALGPALSDPEPAVRRAAVTAAAHVGWPGLLAHCRQAATRPTDPDPDAVAALGAFGDSEDEALLIGCLERPDLAAIALGALGALGRVTVVPLLLERMRDPKLGVPAAKAYRRLTGSDAAFGPMPFPRPQVAEGEDESEELPPAPEAARADWQRRSAAMSTELRWQYGRPVSDGALPDDFDALPLDCRRDVHLRLRARGVRVPDLELEALAHCQRR